MSVRISHLRRSARGAIGLAGLADRAARPTMGLMLNRALSLEPQTGLNGLQHCCNETDPEGLTWTVAS